MLRKPPFIATLTTGLLIGSAAAAMECALIEVMTSDEPPATNTSCTTYSTEQLKTAKACHWPFPFRSEEAITFADDMWSVVTACLAGEVLGDDQLVNHPDSYAPRTWSTANAAWTVSVKDKTALNKTLVFLRLEPKP